MVTSTNVADDRKVAKRRNSSPYRKQLRERSGSGHLDKPRHSHKSSDSRSANMKSKGNKTRHSTLWEFIDGVVLYAICISLPTIFGLLLHWYEDNFTNTTPLGAFFASFSTTATSEGTRSSFSNSVFWSASQGSNNLIILQNVGASLGHIYSKLSSFLQRVIEDYMSTNALSDAQFLIIMSSIFALVRVLLAQSLVPRVLAPRRLEAFVRCKSTHLLSSSEYSFGSPERSPNLGERGQSPEPNPRRNYGHLLNAWYTMTVSIHLFLKRFRPAKIPCENMDATQTLRLLSAPRYATAIFRLLFCSCSCTYAYYHFRNTSFWPIWVGGNRTGSTRQCWDLNGSVTLNGSLDSDFDDANASLRYFFLAQASFQIHSLGFHVLSMIMVALYGDGDGVSARASMLGYWRAFSEHVLYFLLTMASFMFSGLRRLGAIAIFALEASSVGLQILQVCINAPDGSLLQNPLLISTLHRFVVVPIFVYCRFFILPFIVQYSAIFESLGWIHQIEKVLSPGFGLLIYAVFNFMILAAFALNFIYLRRLLFHPYVENIKR